MGETVGLEKKRETKGCRAEDGVESRPAASQHDPVACRPSFFPAQTLPPAQGRLAGEMITLPDKVPPAALLCAPAPTASHPIPSQTQLAAHPAPPGRPAGPEPRGHVADMRGGAQSPLGLGRRPPLTQPVQEADQAEDSQAPTRRDVCGHREPRPLLSGVRAGARPVPTPRWPRPAAGSAQPPRTFFLFPAGGPSRPCRLRPLRPGRGPGPARAPLSALQCSPLKVACDFQRFVFAPPACPALLLGTRGVTEAARWLGLAPPLPRAAPHSASP